MPVRVSIRCLQNKSGNYLRATSRISGICIIEMNVIKVVGGRKVVLFPGNTTIGCLKDQAVAAYRKTLFGCWEINSININTLFDDVPGRTGCSCI
jgi:hypothetical protein